MTSPKDDLDNFINRECDVAGNQHRKFLLKKIERTSKTDPDVSKLLTEYKELLVNQLKKQDDYYKFRHECYLVHNDSSKEIKNRMILVLRAMAEELETNGMCFEIFCKLPPLPIFSGPNNIESYFSNIEISLVAGPLGG